MFVGFDAGADAKRGPAGGSTRLLDARFPQAEALTSDEFMDHQADQIDQLLALIYALLALAVIVSLFGIVNTLVLSINERTRELGMLRAIGTSRRQVRRMVRYEAVITALIGGDPRRACSASARVPGQPGDRRLQALDPGRPLIVLAAACSARRRRRRGGPARRAAPRARRARGAGLRVARGSDRAVQPESRRRAPRRAEVADLGAQQLVVDRREHEHPDDEAGGDRPARPRGRGARGRGPARPG